MTHLSEPDLILFVAGDESGVDFDLVRRHASECDECAAALREHAQIEMRMRAWGRELASCERCGAMMAEACEACEPSAAVASEPPGKRGSPWWLFTGYRLVGAAALACAACLGVYMVVNGGQKNPERPAATGHVRVDAGPAPSTNNCADPDIASADGRVSFHYPYAKKPFICFNGWGPRAGQRILIDLELRSHELPEIVRGIHVIGTPADHRVILETTSKGEYPVGYWRLRAFRFDSSQYVVATGFFNERLRGKADSPPYLPREQLFGTLELVVDVDDGGAPVSATSTNKTLDLKIRPLGDVVGEVIEFSWPSDPSTPANPIGRTAPFRGSVDKFRAAAGKLVPGTP